ncbi:MAG: hypothetical protein A2176_04185 [Spirochaetes bacterium RBG_13_51_14]|nr:MAG: hypothetical protein A2176_04185 [Spirochaetes bacterium RBG_13_51_14]
MKAFLLAAGYGERLRPLTDTIPKPLVPVMNVPSICYALTLLKESGITEIVCNIHYLHAQIEEFFQKHDNFGLNVIFSYEPRILGTGGGLMNCRGHFQEGPFVYINTDIVADIDLKAVIESCASSRPGGSLVIGRSAAGGRVTVKGDRIVNLRAILPVNETPEYDFLGAALLTPDIFTHLKKGFSDIVETGFIGLMKKGSLGFYEQAGPWHDIGSLESYREANIALLDMNETFRNRIHEMVGLKPSAVAGSARIGGGAVVVRSVIGDNCRVGDGSFVEESVLLTGAALAAGEAAIRMVKWI